MMKTIEFMNRTRLILYRFFYQTNFNGCHKVRVRENIFDESGAVEGGE